MKKQSMNIPNTLSIIRCLLVPGFVACLLFMRDMGVWGFVIPTLIYALTGLTDMLDGKIARKHNLVTDFGKFIDPLADKFMVLSSMIAILVWMLLREKTTMALVFVWVVLIILLRELGVTSIRLVVAGRSGIVVAASMLGKIKTVSQMVGTIIILIEPAIPMVINDGIVFYVCDNNILSYISMAIMAFTTVFSGIDYLKAYMPYIDSNK
jgi:CDP-diacylglycerol--glycerol-3-phosphate 3-phosphatidyltransferase